MYRPWSFLCVCKESALLPPHPLRLAFRFPRWLTDLSSLLYQGSPSFFCCWGRVCMCVCACECVILFPDLELIPFKTLLKTLMWDWFMFASTIAPPFVPPPHGPTGRAPAGGCNQGAIHGRQKQSVDNKKKSLWWDFECYLLPDLCCILYMIHTFGLICKFALIAD